MKTFQLPESAASSSGTQKGLAKNCTDYRGHEAAPAVKQKSEWTSLELTSGAGELAVGEHITLTSERIRGGGISSDKFFQTRNL
jgi:hypothetical protein